MCRANHGIDFRTLPIEKIDDPKRPFPMHQEWLSGFDEASTTETQRA